MFLGLVISYIKSHTTTNQYLFFIWIWPSFIFQSPARQELSTIYSALPKNSRGAWDRVVWRHGRAPFQHVSLCAHESEYCCEFPRWSRRASTPSSAISYIHFCNPIPLQWNLQLIGKCWFTLVNNTRSCPFPLLLLPTCVCVTSSTCIDLDVHNMCMIYSYRHVNKYCIYLRKTSIKATEELKGTKTSPRDANKTEITIITLTSKYSSCGRWRCWRWCQVPCAPAQRVTCCTVCSSNGMDGTSRAWRLKGCLGCHCLAGAGDDQMINSGNNHWYLIGIRMDYIALIIDYTSGKHCFGTYWWTILGLHIYLINIGYQKWDYIIGINGWMLDRFVKLTPHIWDESPDIYGDKLMVVY